MGWIEPLALGNAMGMQVIDFGSTGPVLLMMLSALAAAGVGIVLALPRPRRTGSPAARLRWAEVK